MSNINITEVTLENAVNTKVKNVTSISACMGIDTLHNNHEWVPTCDTMLDVCYGIIKNTTLFVACNVPNDTLDGKIYAFTSSGIESILAHVSGHAFFKVFIYEDAIIAITTDGKILKIGDINTKIDNDNLQFVDFPERVVDATIISNKLWLLSPTKLYQINGAFDEIIDTEPYPDGIEMQTIVPTVGGDDIVLYVNTDQLPIFVRYQISKKKFSVFTSATPFTIVNAILVNINSPILYVYASDTKVRTLKLADNIGFFDFNVYEGHQWVGKCSYYDGYVYNQYLDLTSGSPKLFLTKSINGIIFQIVTEEFDYYGDEFGKYCQGDGQSVFISPTMYRIKSSHICGIDYSRYCDMIEIKDVPCIGQSDLHHMDFDVSDTSLVNALIDETSFFVNLKICGKATASTKVDSIRRDVNSDGDMIITVYTGNSFMMIIEDFSDITADFVVKRIW